ncbi:MAG: ATP-binding cassette domain-containing protein [Ferrovibrio sp.]
MRMPGARTAYALFRETLLARRHIFVQAAVASLLANTLALAAAFYSMQVYDRVIPTQGLSTLTVLTVGVLIAITLELVVKLARAHVLEAAIKGMDLELSHAIFARLLKIRLDQFPASVGTLSAQLRSYELIRRFASSAALYLAVDTPFALLFLFVIALLAGFQMALIPLAFFVLAIAIGLFYRQRIARHAETGNAAANRKLGLLVETVENAESIKATNSGERQMRHWDAINRQSVDDDIQIQRYSEQATYLAAFMQQVSYVMLIAAGAWIASTTTDLTMGGLIACAILSGRVLGPVAMLPGLIVQWAHARAALDSLEKVFALQNDNHAVVRPLMPENIRGEWRIENLKFNWPGRPRPLTLPPIVIRPGEKVALIGPVGSGKSTLLKLMAGLYAPTEGQILLDGLDIQQIDRAHLSARLGYLPQDIKLLAGTLRDNLTAGLPNITESALLEAARATGLDQLIASHPRGLDMPIFEGGSGVSGGQKQLIALTRLLLANPSAWLLDEPTAAMDEATEQKSLAALRRAIRPEHTLILVTHKPLLLDLVERLIVLLPGGGVMDGPKQAVLDHLRRNAGPMSAAAAKEKAA